MFCSKCGKTIADDSQFCRYCGATIESEIKVNDVKKASAKTTAEYDFSVDKNKSEHNAKSKIKTFCLVMVFVAIAISLFVYLEEIGCIGIEYTNDTNETTVNEKIPTAEGDYEAYEAVFAGTDIIHVALFSEDDAVTERYVKKNADGTIVCRDFAHKDGVVYSTAETHYYPMHGKSETEFEAQEEYLRELNAELGALEFVKISFEKTGNYLEMKIMIRDVEELSNIIDLHRLGVVTSSTDTVSMADTEKDLIAQGFIKR